VKAKEEKSDLRISARALVVEERGRNIKNVQLLLFFAEKKFWQKNCFGEEKNEKEIVSAVLF
jgi:hypothetical protein